MDELVLLRDFRLEDAAADRARDYARAALRSAMTRRRLPRRYVVALAFAVATLLAATAYAIVHEFVVGEPAPKELNKEIAYFVGKTIPPSILTPSHPHPALAGKPRVAAAAQTRWGPIYLITAPLRGGGECRYPVFPGDRALGTVGELITGANECTVPAHPPYLWFTVTHMTLVSLKRTVFLVEGYAPHAVRMRIGGQTYETPLGWFLAEYRGTQKLVAFDSGGHVVGRTTVR
jgi:hypothetical protein